jgi:Tfp pilus assembly protein PilN
MVEVNLLPGSKRPARRRFARVGVKVRMPSLRGLPAVDRVTLLTVFTWIVVPLLVGWLFFTGRSRASDLQLAIEKAQQDSTRYAGVIASVKSLEARRDTIAQKLQVVEAIDARRYIWPHILDEVSRALPEYTWLTKIDAIADTTGTSFRVSGVTSSNFLLTEYLKDLEASPFIKDVTLISTEQSVLGKSLVYTFVLQASYEQPPPDAIHTVPLFVGQQGEADGTAPE